MSDDNIRQLFEKPAEPEPRQSYARGPGKKYSDGPIITAYVDTNALDVDCVNCMQPVGEFCVHENGALRKSPCPRRIATAARKAASDA